MMLPSEIRFEMKTLTHVLNDNNAAIAWTNSAESQKTRKIFGLQCRFIKKIVESRGKFFNYFREL